MASTKRISAIIAPTQPILRSTSPDWIFGTHSGAYASLPTPPFTPEEKKLVAQNVYAHVWQQAMGAGIKNARFLEQPDKVFSDLDVDSFFRRRGAGGAASAKKVAP